MSKPSEKPYSDKELHDIIRGYRKPGSFRRQVQNTNRLPSPPRRTTVPTAANLLTPETIQQLLESPEKPVIEQVNHAEIVNQVQISSTKRKLSTIHRERNKTNVFNDQVESFLFQKTKPLTVKTKKFISQDIKNQLSFSSNLKPKLPKLKEKTRDQNIRQITGLIFNCKCFKTLLFHNNGKIWEAFLKLLKNKNVGFICLQETKLICNANEQKSPQNQREIERKINGTGFTPFFSCSYKSQFGTASLFRNDVLPSVTYQATLDSDNLVNDAEWLNPSCKDMNKEIYHEPDGRIQIFKINNLTFINSYWPNVYHKNDSSDTRQKKWNKRLEWNESFIDSLTTKNKAIDINNLIIVGDLNSTSSLEKVPKEYKRWPMEELAITTAAMIKKLELVNVSDSAPGWPKTINWSKLLVHKSIQGYVRHVEIIGDKFSSDHFPMILEVEIPMID